MYKRKKKAKAKARVSASGARRTKRKVKRIVKRAVTKRRAPMAKKKSTGWDEEPVAAEEQDVTEAEADEELEAEPGTEPTTTEASEDGVYIVDSAGDVAIKNQVYKKGDQVTLTPEELEAVQAAGVRILPVA